MRIAELVAERLAVQSGNNRSGHRIENNNEALLILIFQSVPQTAIV